MPGGGADYTAEGPPTGSELRWPFLQPRAAGVAPRALRSACSGSVSLSFCLISMLFSQDPELRLLYHHPGGLWEYPLFLQGGGHIYPLPLSPYRREPFQVLAFDPGGEEVHSETWN